MNQIMQVLLGISGSVVMTKEINPSNDIRTIVLIALINAIGIPLINYLGKRVKALLEKYGATESQILQIEIETKKNIIKGLKNKLENDHMSELMKEEMKRHIEKLENDITEMRRELSSRV